MSVQSRLLFETALSLVFEDGYRKDITLEALDAVDKAMAAGSIDAPLLKGIQLFGFREECLKYFQQALNGGSTHPLLYYYLGLYYQREAKDHSLALQYYEMALGGGMDRAYNKIVDYYRPLRSRTNPEIETINKKKCIFYLLDLEMQGVSTSNLYYLISESISPLDEKYKSLKSTYEAIAMEKGSEDAILKDSKSYYWSMYSDANKAIAILKKALNKYGIIHGSAHDNTIQGVSSNNQNDDYNDSNDGVNHVTTNNSQITTHGVSETEDYLTVTSGKVAYHRLWNELLLYLEASTRGISKVTLGEFTSVEEMSLYYSDMLIKHGGYSGYRWKANKYYQRKTSEGRAIAMNIREEADQKGKANGAIYEELIKMYMGEYGHPVDAAKVLEYAERYNKVANVYREKAFALRTLMQVYGGEISPTYKDDSKAEIYMLQLDDVDSSPYYRSTYEILD